jgi:hypothetical protein
MQWVRLNATLAEFVRDFIHKEFLLYNQLLGYPAAFGGLKPAFRDYLLVSSSKIKLSLFCDSLTLKLIPIGCPETSLLTTIHL